MKLSDDPEFLANLVLQRTGAFLKLGGANALNSWFNYGDKEGIVSFLIKNNLVEKYLQEVVFEINKEAKEIRKYIGQDSLTKIVSVGPGNGFIELMLLSEGFTSEILLIDIENSDKHHHGFESQGAGYANLKATKSFIEENVNTKIHLCNPHKEPLPEFEFTLFISLLSMGFHYPCNEYVSFIKQNAATNAIMVFDMRKGIIDSGAKYLLENFQAQDVISERKSDRVFLRNY